MKRSIEVRLSTIVALAMAFAMGAGMVAHAANRPSTEFGLLLGLNGEPQSGTSTATATGSDNTIAVTGGFPYVLNCTTDSVFLGGSTVTVTTGDSITAGQSKYVVTKSATTTLAFRARSAAGVCVANQIQ